MEVTLTGWLLTPVAALAILALFWAALVLLRVARPAGPLSESLLAASTATPLVLYAEVQLLSLCPLPRPLDWLPAAHLALVILLLIIGFAVGGRRIWSETWHALRAGFVGWLRASGLIVALGFAILVILLGLYLAWGMYSVPTLWDELDYHIPMAVQPWHDGRVGYVGSDQPQADLYPRGVELLWYWTLRWTGTDLLFHPTQLAFGLQLILAAYVLARRMPAPPWAAGMAGLIIGTTPIFYLLTTGGYVDVAHAASVVTVLAFLAPPRNPQAPLTQDWFRVALALGEAAIVKYPFLALICTAFALAQTLLCRVHPWHACRTTLRFLITRRGLATLVVLAAGFHWYISLAQRYGNPFYPFRFTVAGHTLLPGMHTPDGTNYGGYSSQTKPIPKMSLRERYYYAWTDFKAGLNIESFGTFGPVLPWAILVPALAFCVAAVVARNSWHICVTALVLFCLAFTPSAVPRYGLPMVSVIIVCALSLLGQLPGPAATGCACALLVACVPGAEHSVRAVRDAWRSELASADFSWFTRNLYWAERYEAGAPTFASTDITRYIRDHVGAGKVLGWNVRTFPTLLFNRHWSNPVRHLPGPAREFWPGSAADLTPLTAEELDAWCRQLKEVNPDFVLLYVGSYYGVHLGTHPQLGYRVAFQDYAARGRYAMVLFERIPADSQPAAAPASAPASAP